MVMRPAGAELGMRVVDVVGIFANMMGIQVGMADDFGSSMVIKTYSNQEKYCTTP